MLNEKKRRALGCAALALLAGALIFFNFVSIPLTVTQQAKAQTAEDLVLLYPSDAPLGHEAGDQLPDFTITKTDGEAFTLSANRGKTVVINLWATWCGPCVKELPFFDQLQQAHPEDVRVLAIHSNLITEKDNDIAPFLDRLGLPLAFAVDEEGGVIELVGGSTLLPQTLVLNDHGEVVYNQVGSVTLSVLEELVAEAQGN